MDVRPEFVEVKKMESPGEHLKREREVRKVSIAKIFEATRVPMKFLEALEADEYDTLPHPAFVKGFIRSYCKVLGLDETDAVLRYEIYLKDKAAEKAEEGKGGRASLQTKQKKPSLPKLPSVTLPKSVRIAIPVVAGVIIMIAAYSLSSRTGAPVPEPAVQAPEPVSVAAPAETSAAPALQAEPQVREPVKTVTAPAQEPAAPAVKTPPASTPLQAVKPLQTPLVQPVKKEDVVKLEPEKEKEPLQAEKKPQTLTASATETVWLKVGIDGGEPTEVLLRQGERFTWKAADNFSVLVGNAGGVSLTYNGKELSKLGVAGEVVSLNLGGAKKPEANPAQPSPQGLGNGNIR